MPENVDAELESGEIPVIAACDVIGCAWLEEAGAFHAEVKRVDAEKLSCAVEVAVVVLALTG